MIDVIPAYVEGNLSHLYVYSGNGFLSVYPVENRTHWLPVPSSTQLGRAMAVLTPSGGILGYRNYVTPRTIAAGWMEETAGTITFVEDGTQSRSAQEIDGVARSGNNAYLITSSEQTTSPATLQHLYRRGGGGWTELQHPRPIQPLLAYFSLAANATNLFVCMNNPDGSAVVSTLSQDGAVVGAYTVETGGEFNAGCHAGSARQGVPAFFWRREAGLTDLGSGRAAIWNGRSWDTQTVAYHFDPDSMAGHGRDLFIAGSPTDDASKAVLYHSQGDGKWTPCSLPPKVDFDHAQGGRVQLFSAADAAWLAFIHDTGPDTPDNLVVAKLTPNICQS
ncbi:MAG: hypothetical protein LC623_00835 [Halobacteriales archaeon]|nr:hypothetical protein [Halobacteriales archaeon]